MGAQHRVRREVAIERWVANDHLIQQAPERVQIGSLVDLPAEDLLGWHVLRGSQQRIGTGDARLFRREALRESKVEDLHAIALEEHHIVRFEIAMNDAFAMSGGERFTDLRADPNRAREWKALTALELVDERLAAQELHHDVQHAVIGLPEIEDRHDRRVLQPTRQPRLAQKPLRDRTDRRELRMDHLDRDLAIDRELPAAIHGAHAAIAEHATDLVAMVEDPPDQRVGLRDELDQPAPVRHAEQLVDAIRAVARRAVRLVAIDGRRLRRGDRGFEGARHCGVIVMVSPGPSPSGKNIR